MAAAALACVGLMLGPLAGCGKSGSGEAGSAEAGSGDGAADRADGAFGASGAADTGDAAASSWAAGTESGAGAGPATPVVAGEVVLYSSADDALLKQVVAAFEAATGVRVRAAGDTEATKTTGLVERLLEEAASPKADVWWSSEPFGTVRLAGAGVLEPYESASAEASVEGGWPRRLRGVDASGAVVWYGFAQRARVIAYSTDRVGEGRAPRVLAALASAEWAGRVGLADPRFGTTRGHMGVLLQRWGEAAFGAWIGELGAGGARVYDGNASVVRAIWQGEIDVGLTDTDDVWAAQRNGWPVGFVYEVADEQALPPSLGPLLLPNTVGLVRGGPHPAAGRRLVDFLLSESCERLMAESESRNVPVSPTVAAEFPELAVPDALLVNFSDAAERVPRAVEMAGTGLRR